MSVKHLISCAAAALLLVPVSVANAQPSGFQAHAGHGNGPAIDAVRDPQEGAMGVHFVKPPLFDDEIDLQEPEALVYEPKRGGLQLVAAEYIAPAAVWHTTHPPDVTPQLAGHLFHYVSGPNRYGPGAFYELHVWAFKPNASGAFADWNPAVSCAPFDPS
jgi:hypothetical protein